MSVPIFIVERELRRNVWLVMHHGILTNEKKALDLAKEAAECGGTKTRVIRVLGTVVASVKP